MYRNYVDKIKFLLIKIGLGIYPPIVKNSIRGSIYCFFYYLEASRFCPNLKKFYFLHKRLQSFAPPKLAIFSLPRSGLHLILNMLNLYISAQKYNDKDLKYDAIEDSIIDKYNTCSHPMDLRNYVYGSLNCESEKEFAEFESRPFGHCHHPLVLSDLYNQGDLNCLILTRDPLTCLKSQYYFYNKIPLNQISKNSKSYSNLKKLSEKIINFFNFWHFISVMKPTLYKNLMYVNYDSLILNKNIILKKILMKSNVGVDEELIRYVSDFFEKKNLVQNINISDNSKVLSKEGRDDFNPDMKEYFSKLFNEKIYFEKSKFTV